MHRQIAFVIAAVIGLGSGVLAQKPEADVQALTQQYEQAFNKGDAKALAAMYSNEAVRLGPDGELLSGRSAIEKQYATVFGGAAKGVKLTLRPGRVQNVTPDVRIAEGTYEATGGTMPSRGRYVNTLVREAGQWRFASVVVVPESSAGGKPATSAPPKPGGTTK